MSIYTCLQGQIREGGAQYNKVPQSEVCLCMIHLWFALTCVLFVATALLVSKLASKVADILNSAHEESGSQSTDDDGPSMMQVVSSNGMFQCDK